MKKSLSTLAAIMLYGQVFACVCDKYDFDFYKNVTHDHKLGVFVFHSLEVHVHPSGFKSVFGNVILLESFDAGLGDTVTLILNDGVNCAEYAGAFNIGDTLVLAMEDWIYWPPYGQDTFYLNGCGIHYLKLIGGQHDGLTIPEIKDKIFDIILSADHPSSGIELVVFPNPAYENVTIKLPFTNILSVDLFDMQGRWLFRKENASEVVILDLSGIIPGLYLLSVMTDLGVNVQKLVKY